MKAGDTIHLMKKKAEDDIQSIIAKFEVDTAVFVEDVRVETNSHHTAGQERPDVVIHKVSLTIKL